MLRSGGNANDGGGQLRAPASLKYSKNSLVNFGANWTELEISVPIRSRQCSPVSSLQGNSLFHSSSAKTFVQTPDFLNVSREQQCKQVFKNAVLVPDVIMENIKGDKQSQPSLRLSD